MATSMKDTLVAQLLEARDLLQVCSLEERADWFGAKAEALASLDPLSHAFQSGVQDIAKILVGMGSFSDSWLQPSEGANLSEEDANKLLWCLTEDIGQSCKALLLPKKNR